MITTIRTGNRTYIPVKEVNAGIVHVFRFKDLVIPANFISMFDWEFKAIRRLYER